LEKGGPTGGGDVERRKKDGLTFAGWYKGVEA